LFQQRRRHVGQRLGGIGEALAGGTVGGKLARGPQINPRQVPNRAVVFGIAQAAQRDLPGVAGQGPRFRIQETAYPG